MEETWADLRARLEAAGASEQTVEALRRATAGARHAARVRRVVDSALAKAREHLAGARVRGEEIYSLSIGGAQWWANERERLVAALLIAIELRGAGGPGGLGGPGCATERMPIFADWGRGRRHAADGAAWDAAASHALRCLAPQTHVGYDVGLTPARVIELSRELVPARFALATARASLLAVIQAEDRDAVLVLDVPDGEIRLVVHDTAAEWAAAAAMIEAQAAE